MSKLKKVTDLKKLISTLKKNGKSIVFTNGCFDLLHPGHIKILCEAKNKGDILVVGLNSDSSVRRLKGQARPVLNEKARAILLSAISYVDYIVIFKEDTPYKLIKGLRPDILVKGEDWQTDKIIGRKFARKIFRVKFCPGYSTTALIKKIKSV
jgi:D-beta-D-heptose 7-phosphate kinase/D-beta-D-heptose 1-phosphate adenosyltransferase